MSYSRQKMRDAGPSPRQIRAYGIAATAACLELGIAGAAEQHAYRAKVVEEETGCASIKRIRSEGDYEAVMARLWMDANDYQQAAKYSIGNERRMAYNVKVLAIQLMQLKSTDEAEAKSYIGGVLDRARIPNGTRADDDSYWLDIRPDQVTSLFQILDTERRRVLKRFGNRVGALSDRIRYTVDGPILTRQEVPRDYYAKAAFKVTVR